MKIVVCIKQVPDTMDVKIDPVTKNLIREGIQGVINPFDKNALEEAVKLKESTGAQVIVISMGPEQVKESLREALAMGADEAILLSDRRFGGADTLATGYVLSRSICKIGGVDMVLCGERAVDADTGQVGPILAEFLGYSQATYLRRLKLSDSGKFVITERLLEDAREIVEVELPAVFTCTKELNEPRYPTPIKIMKAAKKEIPVWGFDDLEVEANRVGLEGSPTRVLEIFTPKRSKSCNILSGDLTEAAQSLFDNLRKHKVL